MRKTSGPLNWADYYDRPEIASGVDADLRVVVGRLEQHDAKKMGFGGRASVVHHPLNAGAAHWQRGVEEVDGVF